MKVGDRVKCIEAENSNNGELEKGKIYIVSQIDEEGYVKIKGLSDYKYDPSRFKKIKYTYEDLKKSPIGTKIVFEKGEVLVKYDYYWYNGDSYLRNDSDLKELKDKDKQLGKIIKIEEPEYRTVYEAKVEILDEVEKRYLKNIIRPYLDKIKSIEKFIFSTGRAKITITVKDGNDYWYINLPPFKKETMYKNMEDDKEYTLEELGL